MCRFTESYRWERRESTLKWQKRIRSISFQPPFAVHSCCIDSFFFLSDHNTFFDCLGTVSATVWTCKLLIKEPGCTERNWQQSFPEIHCSLLEERETRADSKLLHLYLVMLVREFRAEFFWSLSYVMHAFHQRANILLQRRFLLLYTLYISHPGHGYRKKVLLNSNWTR